MKDLIIGAITKLSWEQCLPWVNSINRSGFTGDKVVCIFGEDRELAEKFVAEGFQPLLTRYLNDNENVCVTRFFMYYVYLMQNPNKYRAVFATDVTDVLFQNNPSEFIDKVHNEESEECIWLSAENIKYADETWGRNNLTISFGPAAFERLKNNEIVNCGVLAGTQELIKDLFLNIHLACDGKPHYVQGPRFGGPDQAALNYIMDLLPYRKMKKVISHDTGWACQAGTTADPYKDYDSINIGPNPLIDGDTVVTSTGLPYYIVHQYNRNTLWEERLLAKYV